MDLTIEPVVDQLPEDITCVDTNDASLFIGTQSGEILHYVVAKSDPDSDARTFTYLQASRQAASETGPVSAILVLPSLSLAAVVSNGLLSFYQLPELAPTSELRTVKDVRGIVRTHEGASASADGVELTIFTSKKVRQIKVTRSTIKLSKEVEYVDARTIAQDGSVVCAATRAAYDLLELDQKATIPLFPVVQGEADPQGTRYDPYVARIVRVAPGEFLLASGSPESSTAIGMFVTNEGEITRGTLMFGAYPLALLCDGDRVLALLSNGTLEIHDINSQAVLTTLPAQGCTLLMRVSGQLASPDQAVLEKLLTIPFTGELEKLPSKELDVARRATETSSDLVLVGSGRLSILSQGSALRQIDRLLDDGDAQQAVATVEALAKGASSADKDAIRQQVAYTHQKAGLLYLRQLLFDDAIDNLNKGGMDPRVLLSLFPDFAVNTDGATIYSGVKDVLRDIPSVNTLIHENLKQTVDDDETLNELQSILLGNAKELLRRNLTKYRERVRKSSRGSTTPGLAEVEHALLQILLSLDRAESRQKLREFFELPVANMSQAEALLKGDGRYMLLTDMLLSKSANRLEDVLNLWRRLLDGEIADQDTPADLQQQYVAAVLASGTEDHIWDCTLWLISRDLVEGLDFALRAVEKPAVSWGMSRLMDELRTQEMQYLSVLQQLVLVRGLRDSSYTTELVQFYAGHLVQLCQDNRDACQALVQLTKRYTSLTESDKPSYLAYLGGEIAGGGSAALHQIQRHRKQFIAILEADLDCDAAAILRTIEARKDVLLPERVLLAGKLERHGEALDVIVNDLKDFDAAQWYCYHGGGALAWQADLQGTAGDAAVEQGDAWGLELDPAVFANLSVHKSLSYDIVDRKALLAKRQALFPQLLARILSQAKPRGGGARVTDGAADGSERDERAIELLNRWGRYFDLAKAMQEMPDDWQLRRIRDFLKRGLQLAAQKKRAGLIERTLSRTALERLQTQEYVTLND